MYYIPPIHWGVQVKVLKEFLSVLEKSWSDDRDELKKLIKDYINNRYQPITLHHSLRVVLTGEKKAPPNHDVMWALGKEETLRRINNGIVQINSWIEEEKLKFFGDMLDMNYPTMHPPKELIDKVFDEQVNECIKTEYAK